VRHDPWRQRCRCPSSAASINGSFSLLAHDISVGASGTSCVPRRIGQCRCCGNHRGQVRFCSKDGARGWLRIDRNFLTPTIAHALGRPQ
jgi:hypothetical protein